jgi:hypothetical protein
MAKAIYKHSTPDSGIPVESTGVLQATVFIYGVDNPLKLNFSGQDLM